LHDPANPFSPDYFTARDRFRAAAVRLNGRLEAVPFSTPGANGEVLTMDVAHFGDPDPRRVVIVSSGLHGVEGFSGSAVQLAWLNSRPPEWSPAPGTALVMAHALNPFGFVHGRRWNENNVDLNRNFLLDRAFLTDDPGYRACREAYARQHAILNPPTPPTRREPFHLKALVQILREGYAARDRLPVDRRPNRLDLRTIIRLGSGELKKVLPVGQYEHPRAIFYGGAGDEETTRLLKAKIPAWAGDAEQVIHLDLHTGLGAFGECKLLVEDVRGSARERWATAHFGPEVEATDGTTAYQARGDIGLYFETTLGDRYQCLTVEFGTYDGTHMLWALRAENRAHWYARPGSGIHRWAKRILKDAFVPASPAWRRKSVRDGVRVIGRALQVIGAEQPANSEQPAIASDGFAIPAGVG
jgi:hypothetical protein